jgi:choline dehydrogenase-like flavoprotein
VKTIIARSIPNTVDKYGIPVLRFHYKWSDYEVKQAKHMKQTFAEIIDKMGGVVTYGKDDNEKNDWGLLAPGRIIHEVGTTRMGNDPKKSALNKFNQAHECKNLFVVDGGPFVSQADKNPTWTILALSMRASEYIIDEIEKTKYLTANIHCYGQTKIFKDTGGRNGRRRTFSSAILCSERRPGSRSATGIYHRPHQR